MRVSLRSVFADSGGIPEDLKDQAAAPKFGAGWNPLLNAFIICCMRFENGWQAFASYLFPLLYFHLPEYIF